MTIDIDSLLSELKAFLELENIPYDLSDAKLKLLLKNKISEFSSYTNLEICPVSHKDIVRGYSGSVYEVDFYPVTEVVSLQVGSTTLTSDDIVIDNERGILYFDTPLSGMLVIEYTSCVTDMVFIKKVKPLLFDMVKYVFTSKSSVNGNVSSVKEGDVQVNYDTSSSLGGLIEARMNNLKSEYSCKIRML